MGLFDNVYGEFQCLSCGNIQRRFQTKEGPCILGSFDFREVDSFYASCDECGAWIVVELKPKIREEIYSAMEKLRMSLTTSDYEVTIEEEDQEEMDDELLDEAEEEFAEECEEDDF